MTTYFPLPAPAATAVDLRAQAVEQVMRSCDDDLAVLEMLELEPGSRGAAASLGRLMHTHPMRLLAGCPLIAWVSGSAVDSQWRRAYPARPHSLYDQLEMLSALYGEDADDQGPDSYTYLETLRLRSEHG